MNGKIVFEIVAASIAVMILASGVAVGVNTVYIAADGSESKVSLPPPAIYAPDDYSTIQAAVNAASPGDTIIVRDGTYNETVKVDKRLTLRSENGSDKTIVQAANSEDHIFKVTAGHVNISGFTVRGASDDTGIYIYCANNCVISNNTCSNNMNGIFLFSSDSNSIVNNTCSNNTVGIYPLKASNNSISNNTCSYNSECGIHLGYSNSSSISNNNCSYNSIGIPLTYSNSNSISNNVCSANNNTGIALQFSSNNSISNNTCSYNMNGIFLFSSDSNSIVNNTCSNNTVGISPLKASNNSISNNTCSYNSLYGIFLWYSSNNKIYFNNFINNTDNVDSHKSTTIWNSPLEITYTYDGTTYKSYLGNYWDDYEGTDADADGIGDTPYSIDFNSDESDDYPLMKLFENYFA